MLTRQSLDTLDTLSPSSLKAVLELAGILGVIESFMVPTRSGEGIATGKPESRPPGDVRAATAHRKVLGRIWAVAGHSRREVNVLCGTRLTVPEEYRRVNRRERA